MRFNTLGKTGLRVSTLGFGCAPLGNVYGTLDDKEATRVVHAAIDAGINFFDTSPYYGLTLSETRLGLALQGKRDRVILATKGGRFDIDGFDFSYDNIKRMCEASLQRLQTDWLDVYQLHDIEFGPREAILSGIEALRELRAEGKVRAIGVTGFPVALLREMAATQELDVTLSYCHGNLMNQMMNEVLVPTVESLEMGLINASVTHMGILTPQGPQPWHSAPAELKAAGQAAADVCAAHDASLPALAIQYALSNRHVDVTLLGTRDVSELNASLELLETPLDDALLAEVQAVIEPVHNQSWPSGLEMYWETG